MHKNKLNLIATGHSDKFITNGLIPPILSHFTACFIFVPANSNSKTYMMKTLVVIIHPDMEHSVINKRWIAELEKYPDQYTLHNLHQLYPDEKIDVEREQKLIEAHDKIIFQFPFYWFNCPPFFKKWLDEVLTDGWAYGRNSGYKMAGKKIALGITAGINKADYTASGRYKYTLEQLTAPF